MGRDRCGGLSYRAGTCMIVEDYHIPCRGPKGRLEPDHEMVDQCIFRLG